MAPIWWLDIITCDKKFENVFYVRVNAETVASVTAKFQKLDGIFIEKS